MQTNTPQLIPVINPSIPSALIKSPYQKHSPAKGEELDEFVNSTDDGGDRENQDEDYEQIETKINRPKTKFPDDNLNSRDNPVDPDSNEDGDDEEDEDNEIVTSVGY